MNLEIHPQKGIGEITFGMTRGNLEKLLGEPDETELFSMDEEEELTETWHYDVPEVSVSFEEDLDFRLTTIATSNEECTLAGKKIIGMTEKELVHFLESINFGNIEEEELSEEDEEDDDFFDFRTLKVEDKDIYFWFDNGVLSEVQLGVKFDTEDNPQW